VNIVAEIDDGMDDVCAAPSAPDTDSDELSLALSSPSEAPQQGEYKGRNVRKKKAEVEEHEAENDDEGKSWSDYIGWGVGANNVFRPVSSSVPTLPPGTYKFSTDGNGNLIVIQMSILTDDLTFLPDSANERVLSGIQKFWSREEAYRNHGLLFKRGVLLWGPPGSGKTVTITQLSNDLVNRGGLVIFCENPKLAMMGLDAVRRIEPDRPVILILEDVDEIIRHYDEHDLLSLLDGENQVDNVVMIATTNYPEKLGARIINRPSRFDECVKVGMPSDRAREAYIKGVTKEAISETDIQRWVKDTKGLSIAHIRELAAAVLCLDQDYATVIKRLRDMCSLVKPESGFKEGGKVGFNSPKKSEDYDFERE
jgi:ATPase family associated with various cellular activities (AAA)